MDPQPGNPDPKSGRRATWVAGAALAVLGVAQRLVLWLAYPPIEYGDTSAYLRLGQVLSTGTMVGYDGRRVPGYPALTALAGGDACSIYALQLGLGVAISLLLFWMTYRATRSPGLSFSVGLLYDLIPGQFLFEANLLSETLTAFLLVLTMTVLAETLRVEDHRAGLGWVLLLGACSALPGLTRPEYYFLPVWLLPFILYRVRGLRRALLRLIVYLPLPALMLGGWVSYIYSTYHMLSPTVVVGYGLVQHTGTYFEDLPDADAAIRDTYIRLRDERIAARGDQTNTIWTAIPELTRASGMSFYDLSRELQRLSLRLIRAHPARYASTALEGWVDFWKAPVYGSMDDMQPAPARTAMQTWAMAGRLFSVAANGAFLALSVAALSGRIRRRLGVGAHMLAVGGVVWITSILQTLFEHGDNPRFLVPGQMLVFYLLAVIAYAWWTGRGRPGRTKSRAVDEVTGAGTDPAARGAATEPDSDLHRGGQGEPLALHRRIDPASDRGNPIWGIARAAARRIIPGMSAPVERLPPAWPLPFRLRVEACFGSGPAGRSDGGCDMGGCGLSRARG